MKKKILIVGVMSLVIVFSIVILKNSEAIAYNLKIGNITETEAFDTVAEEEKTNESTEIGIGSEETGIATISEDEQEEQITLTATENEGQEDGDSVIYQSATLFLYDTDTLNSLTKALEDGTQGIYFSDGGDYTTIDGETIANESHNICTEYGYGNIPYTGIAKSTLSSGNIEFNYPQAGIFDTSTTAGKNIYENVQIPFLKNSDGSYSMNSDEIDVNFANGIANSNTSLVYSKSKNTYLSNTDTSITGFFPFNSTDGEDAIYHFGLNADIVFCMTSDGMSLDDSDELIFEFSGDDDLWVYIDGQLVIDLGGVHGAITAQINFATDEVIQYYGQTSQEYETTTLSSILGEDWDSNITDEHTLSIYYLERGAGGSNCNISYNLLTLEDVTTDVIVHSYLENSTTKIADDEEYSFGYGTSYTITESDQIPDKYELVSVSGNPTGTVNEETIEVIYYYRVKTYEITTQVDGEGGTISGEGETPYEEIEYGENSTKEIEIIPDEGYSVESITVNGENIEYTENTDGTVTLEITNVTEDKEIVVKFREEEPEIYRYTINYYYDGELDENETIEGTAGEGTKITYIDKTKAGYELDDEKTTETTMIITADESSNILNIYYATAEEETIVYGYTINYYYDGVQDEDETITGTAEEGTKITYTDKIREEYELDTEKTTETTMTITTDESSNILNIYYATTEEETIVYGYTINYYYDGELDENETITGTAEEGTKITYTYKIKDGYKLDTENTTSTTMTITTDESANILNVYYVTAEEDTYTAVLPQTGVNMILLISFITICIACATGFYINYRKNNY